MSINTFVCLFGSCAGIWALFVFGSVIRFLAFAVNKSDEGFTGSEPRQMTVKTRRFESRVGPHYQGTDVSHSSSVVMNSVSVFNTL
jgi:hypothetical protein